MRLERVAHRVRRRAAVVDEAERAEVAFGPRGEDVTAEQGERGAGDSVDVVPIGARPHPSPRLARGHGALDVRHRGSGRRGGRRRRVVGVRDGGGGAGSPLPEDGDDGGDGDGDGDGDDGKRVGKTRRSRVDDGRYPTAATTSARRRGRACGADERGRAASVGARALMMIGGGACARVGGVCRVRRVSGRQSESLLVAYRSPIPNRTQSGPARLGRRMTVPSHAVGDLDDVDDRLDALRKRLARGSDVSITVGTARREEEGRVSPERLSRESSKELSVPPAASGPRDERPPRPRRTEPVDIMPSPTARSPRPSSPRSSTTAATNSRRWSAHYDVNTTPALTSPGRTRARGRVRVAREVRHRPDLPSAVAGRARGGRGRARAFDSRRARRFDASLDAASSSSRG